VPYRSGHHRLRRRFIHWL